MVLVKVLPFYSNMVGSIPSSNNMFFGDLSLTKSLVLRSDVNPTQLPLQFFIDPPP